MGVKAKQPGALWPMHRTLGCDENQLAQLFPLGSSSLLDFGQKQKETQTFVALLKP